MNNDFGKVMIEFWTRPLLSHKYLLKKIYQCMYTIYNSFIFECMAKILMKYFHIKVEEKLPIFQVQKVVSKEMWTKSPKKGNQIFEITYLLLRHIAQSPAQGLGYILTSLGISQWGKNWQYSAIPI